MEVLFRETEQEKEIKGIQIRKEEVSLLLFIDDILHHIKSLRFRNSKDSTKKVLELVNKFSKVIGYYINTEKSNFGSGWCSSVD